MNPSGNNTFGTISSGGMTPGGVSAPVSSGGDIVIGGGGTAKKSKKWLILGIVAVLVLLGVGGAVVFFRSQPNLTVSESIYESFSRYGNYLINGEEDSVSRLEMKKDESGEEGEAMIYSMIVDDEDENQATSYMKKLGDYWGDFGEKMDSFTLSDGLTMDDYTLRLEFLLDYVQNRNSLTDGTIMKDVMNRSAEEIQATIDNYVASFNDYDFPEARGYTVSVSGYYEQVVAMMQELKNMGCISADGLSFTCDDETISGVQAGYESIGGYGFYITDSITAIIDYVVDNCWNINSAMLGIESSSEEGEA